MKSPYEILGVSPSASDDEIKQAYRALAKKYHPDNYTDSPLADLASEKMAEINAAYDQIQEMRKNGSASSRQNSGSGGAYGAYGFGGSYSGGYQQNTGANNGPFADIRRLIATGRVIEADELLNGVPASSRDAEWHYLKGRILHSRGFLEDSIAYFRQAVDMNPSNPEYRQWLNMMENQRTYGYQGNHGPQTVFTTLPCQNLCATLLCLQCVCGGCCFPFYR
jgi:curved DNA-binding protein CbpA